MLVIFCAPSWALEKMTMESSGERDNVAGNGTSSINSSSKIRMDRPGMSSFVVFAKMTIAMELTL